MRSRARGTARAHGVTSTDVAPLVKPGASIRVRVRVRVEVRVRVRGD